MNINFKLIRINIHPERNGRTNVVATVQWMLIATRNGHESSSFVDSIIPIGGLSEFTPIDQLTKEQILEWSIAAQGGQSFINMLMQHHEMVISEAEARAGVEIYLGPLAFELDVMKNQNFTGEIPVATL